LPLAFLGLSAGDDDTMTKSDLIDVLCETQKMPKGRAELLVNVIFESMEASLRRGERIEIRGFGSFEIREYRAYEGRNPRTGSSVAVRPKRLPFFKVGKELKERVNAGARRGAKPAPAEVARLTDESGRAGSQAGSQAASQSESDAESVESNKTRVSA
jgi:integration host factor subunit beta